jgi:hypothetical protein
VELFRVEHDHGTIWHKMRAAAGQAEGRGFGACLCAVAMRLEKLGPASPLHKPQLPCQLLLPSVLPSGVPCWRPLHSSLLHHLLLL